MKTDDIEKTGGEGQSEKKRPKLISIRAKIMFAFIVVFLIPVIAMLFLLSRRMPDSFDELARVRVSGALEGMRGDFDSLRTDVEKRVESIAEDPKVRKDIFVLSSSLTDKFNFRERIATIRDTSGLDTLKVVTDKKLLIANSQDTTQFNRSVEDDSYLDGVLRSGQSTVVLRIEEVENDKKVTVVVYQPVWYLGSPVAVVIGGKHIGEEYVKKLQDLTTGTVALFVDYRPVVCSRGGAPSACLPVSRSFLEKLESEPGTITQVGRGEADYLAGGVPIRDPQTGNPIGFFVIGISRESVKQMMGRTTRDMFYLALMGLVISIVLAFVISVSITRPISHLVRFARRIGRGEFSGASIPVQSRDEIGLLADTMNRMVKDLDEYSSRLAYSERMAAWSEIARRMAHEIKNPLSPIQLSMENLKASFQDDKVSFNRVFPESVDTVLEEVEKLRKLANEFSEFARLPKPVFEKVELCEMIRNLLSFHGSANDDIEFLPDLDVGPVTVNADRDQLNRVFTNLIKNAVEAMPDGGRLEVSVHAREGEIFVVFQDSGQGIPQEIIDKIFTPYYTSKSGGSGLGLSIVKRIIRDHDASIDVVSAPGGGSMFTIVFKESGGDKTRGGA
ncbi:PAS domain-containing sensor histidine kinase [bacterium]